MKRTIAFLFGFVAIAVLLLFFYDAFALPLALTKPVAECKNGVCTMSEKDYETLRSFHSTLVVAAADVVESNNELTDELARTRNALRNCLHRKS